MTEQYYVCVCARAWPFNGSLLHNNFVIDQIFSIVLDACNHYHYIFLGRHCLSLPGTFVLIHCIPSCWPSLCSKTMIHSLCLCHFLAWSSLPEDTAPRLTLVWSLLTFFSRAAQLYTHLTEFPSPILFVWRWLTVVRNHCVSCLERSPQTQTLTRFFFPMVSLAYRVMSGI